ncbi:MAG: RNA 2',3'-cyclic phosphodiesterase [Candidatus Omnitrophica bacterium]|nr:RNA 2',3'-cyclic phosphodiesterase [Candidatus Omnitrophota bacterium]
MAVAREEVRSFLAIELSEKAKEEVFFFVESIKKDFPNFRFIPSTNWHLTLHFLGEIPLEKLEKLKVHLRDGLKEMRPFTIMLDGFGAFPDFKKARLLWVGVRGDLEPLDRLKKELDQILQKLNFEIETRLFHPHITIGRLKGSSKSTLPAFSPVFRGTVINFINHITLFKSVLLNQSAQYTPLETFPLVEV